MPLSLRNCWPYSGQVTLSVVHSCLKSQVSGLDDPLAIESYHSRDQLADEVDSQVHRLEYRLLAYGDEYLLIGCWSLKASLFSSSEARDSSQPLPCLL